LLHFSSGKRAGIWFAMVHDDEGKLVACAFSLKGAIKSLPTRWRSICKRGPPDPAGFKMLYELYMGQGKIDSDLFDLAQVSRFRQKVYRMIRCIARGRVTTYGAIARKIASRRHARVVDTAVGSNPLPLVVPRHRVVTSSLEVVNCGMPNHKPSEGADVKRGLLEREGVVLAQRRPSRGCLWS